LSDTEDVVRALQAVAPLIIALVAVPLILARLAGETDSGISAPAAQERLNEIVFGPLGGTPRLSVRQGRMAADEEPLLQQVGGPATLAVYDDSAVVTERSGRIARVLGTGVHHLLRHERVWETVDLRPQRWVRNVYGVTREGLPISCNLDLVFRINGASPESGASASSSSKSVAAGRSYSDEAVLAAATSQTVAEQDGIRETRDWSDRVVSIAESILRDTLAAYPLDWLIASPDEDRLHPRDEIHRYLTASLQDAVTDVGAELISVRLGEIRIEIQDADRPEMQQVSHAISDIVSGQWIDAWHARWRLPVSRNEHAGKAGDLPLEAVQTEARVELIVGLSEILRPLAQSDRVSHHKAVAAALIEALQWLSHDAVEADHMAPEALRTVGELQRLLRSAAGEPPTTTRGDACDQPA